MSLRNSEPAYRRSKYLCGNAQEALEMMRKYGVAVVPGMLSEAECKERFGGIVGELEKVVEGFEFSDPETWALLRKNAYLSHAMLMQHFGVAWFQDVVDVRQKDSIVKFWAELWTQVQGERVATEDLLTSADGIALYLNPASETRHGFAPQTKNWLHTDRSIEDQTYSVQSFVNLLKTRDGDAAFHFLERSHIFHEAYAAKFFRTEGRKMPRFNRLGSEEELAFFTEQHGCASVCIRAQPGDLVLWDSRVVHEGLQAQRQRQLDGARNRRRAVIYVSMQPRSLATKADLKRKALAWRMLRMTCHNAARGVKLFAAVPRTYGKELCGIHPHQRRPALSNLGTRLFNAVDDLAGLPAARRG